MRTPLAHLIEWPSGVLRNDRHLKIRNYQNPRGLEIVGTEREMGPPTIPNFRNARRLEKIGAEREMGPPTIPNLEMLGF